MEFNFENVTKAIYFSFAGDDCAVSQANNFMNEFLSMPDSSKMLFEIVTKSTDSVQLSAMAIFEREIKKKWNKFDIEFCNNIRCVLSNYLVNAEFGSTFYGILEHLYIVVVILSGEEEWNKIIYILLNDDNKKVWFSVLAGFIQMVDNSDFLAGPVKQNIRNLVVSFKGPLVKILNVQIHSEPIKTLSILDSFFKWSDNVSDIVSEDLIQLICCSILDHIPNIEDISFSCLKNLFIIRDDVVLQCPQLIPLIIKIFSNCEMTNEISIFLLSFCYKYLTGILAASSANHDPNAINQLRSNTFVFGDIKFPIETINGMRLIYVKLLMFGITQENNDDFWELIEIDLRSMSRRKPKLLQDFYNPIFSFLRIRILELLQDWILLDIERRTNAIACWIYIYMINPSEMLDFIKSLEPSTLFAIAVSLITDEPIKSNIPLLRQCIPIFNNSEPNTIRIALFVFSNLPSLSDDPTFMEIFLRYFSMAIKDPNLIKFAVKDLKKALSVFHENSFTFDIFLSLISLIPEFDIKTAASLTKAILIHNYLCTPEPFDLFTPFLQHFKSLLQINIHSALMLLSAIIDGMGETIQDYANVILQYFFSFFNQPQIIKESSLYDQLIHALYMFVSKTSWQVCGSVFEAFLQKAFETPETGLASLDVIQKSRAVHQEIQDYYIQIENFIKALLENDPDCYNAGMLYTFSSFDICNSDLNFVMSTVCNGITHPNPEVFSPAVKSLMEILKKVPTLTNMFQDLLTHTIFNALLDKMHNLISHFLTTLILQIICSYNTTEEGIESLLIYLKNNYPEPNPNFFFGFLTSLAHNIRSHLCIVKEFLVAMKCATPTDQILFGLKDGQENVVHREESELPIIELQSLTIPQNNVL